MWNWVMQMQRSRDTSRCFQPKKALVEAVSMIVRGRSFPALEESGTGGAGSCNLELINTADKSV